MFKNTRMGSKNARDTIRENADGPSPPFTNQVSIEVLSIKGMRAELTNRAKSSFVAMAKFSLVLV